MAFNADQQNIIVKMFAAAMREKFSRLARKYGQEMTFQAWVEQVKKGRDKTQDLEGRWDPGVSLGEAIDILEEYINWIERSIQERLQEGRKK